MHPVARPASWSLALQISRMLIPRGLVAGTLCCYTHHPPGDRRTHRRDRITEGVEESPKADPLGLWSRERELYLLEGAVK